MIETLSVLALLAIVVIGIFRYAQKTLFDISQEYKMKLITIEEVARQKLEREKLFWEKHDKLRKRLQEAVELRKEIEPILEQLVKHFKTISKQAPSYSLRNKALARIYDKLSIASYFSNEVVKVLNKIYDSVDPNDSRFEKAEKLLRRALASIIPVNELIVEYQKLYPDHKHPFDFSEYSDEINYRNHQLN